MSNMTAQQSSDCTERWAIGLQLVNSWRYWVLRFRLLVKLTILGAALQAAG